VRSQLGIGACFPHLLTIGIATLGSWLLILLLSAPFVVARRRRETPPPDRPAHRTPERADFAPGDPAFGLARASTVIRRKMRVARIARLLSPTRTEHPLTPDLVRFAQLRGGRPATGDPQRTIAWLVPEAIESRYRFGDRRVVSARWLVVRPPRQESDGELRVG
jgi:hypothetical protein